MRKKCCYGREKNLGQYSSPSLSQLTFHTQQTSPFENKVWEIYIFIKKCIRSLFKSSLPVNDVSACKCIFVYVHVKLYYGCEYTTLVHCKLTNGYNVVWITGVCFRSIIFLWKDNHWSICEFILLECCIVARKWNRVIYLLTEVVQSYKYYKSRAVGVTSEVGFTTDWDLAEHWCSRNTTPFIPPGCRKSRGTSHYTTWRFDSFL